MRIISGYLGSRKLFVPANTLKVRPTSDRIRESMFNIIENLIVIENAYVLDIFCGTGALGIEAISRGAEFVFFVDKHSGTVQRNIETLGIGNKSEIINADYRHFLNSEDFKELNVSIVFADPPYEFDKYEELISAISQKKTLFVLEHEREISHLKDMQIRHRKSGRTFTTIYDFRK
ncbi:MAG: N6-adenine-specific methylase [Chlorobi bacterium OLB4]|nr:MAG: N6-adenine-specific methylase [Chlorobi bacterium OLB4]MBW7856436.1 RsmD family RNA methyltransferase [Ignavibacteria bacterium]OQY78711.1 MAG: hypothetical protein B6D43_01660 [Ignavibacteriales bacterium UTCHB1]